MYKQIAKRLSLAKRTCKISAIKEALLYLVKEVGELVVDGMSVTTLSDFIYDPELLFSSDTEMYYDDRSDTRVITTGLIDQLLELASIVDHHQIASDLRDAIFELHGSISRGAKSDIGRRRQALRSALDAIRVRVED
jgi:hypothetical protein